MSILKKLRPDGILDPKGVYLNPFNQQPYTKCYYNQSKNWSTYPTWTDHEKIFNMIHNNSVLLLIAATGAGKTVIIPKLLLHYFGYKEKIICTTPRQQTTSSAAEYSAFCMDVPMFYLDKECKNIEDPNILGKDKRILTGNMFIGYQHGASGSKFTDRSTKLLFATDGLIKQRILNDPDLSEYMGIIIDEAHERSVNIDVLIALILSICKRRPEFKVIIMSATIDEKLFTNYFDRIGLKGNYTVYIPKVNTTQYSIDLKPEMRPIDKSKLPEIIYEKIESIILNPKLPTGDILAFVTSESDTVKVEQMIKKNIAKFPLNRRPYTIPFTAGINQTNKDIATKKEALKKIPPDPQMAPNGYALKVIIATNVVESSVTFEDPLVYVVESGLAFEKKFDAANYCYETGKFYVSQASIKQRCGRTGRTNAGYCFQLYTDYQLNNEFIKFTPPKIVLDDITKELLGLSCLSMHNNVKAALSFIENKMIEPVSNYIDAIKVARNNLINMGFANEAGDISQLGRVCNGFGMYDIKIAKMIIGGYYLGCMWQCIILGGILHEIRGLEDLFYKPPGMPSYQADAIVIKNIRTFKSPTGDHLTLLNIFNQWQHSPNRHTFCHQHGLNDYMLSNILKTIEDLYKTVKNNAPMIRSLFLFGVPQEVLTVQDALLHGGGTKLNSDSDNSDNRDNSDYSHDNGDDDDDGDDDELGINEMEREINAIFDKVNKDPTNSMIGGNDWQFADAEKHMNKLLKLQEIDSYDGMHTGGYTNEYSNSFTYNTTLSKNKKTKKQQIGGQQDTVRWEKIMNIISLKDLKPMYLNIPKELSKKIIGALYYGYSTHIASFTGSNKKYNVKYSPIKGAITKSILDIENISPNLIVYYEFIVSIEQNRKTTKLAIVTEIDDSIINIFLNIANIHRELT